MANLHISKARIKFAIFFQNYVRSDVNMRTR